MARDIHTEIEIDATPSQVWAVISDLRKFPEWNDTVRKLDGDAKVGGKVAAEFLMVNGKTQGFSITMAAVDENNCVEWTGGIPLMLMGRHGYKIEDLGDGRSKVVHYEEFKGLMTPFLGKMFTHLEGAYARDNEKLKAHVEANKT